MESRDCRNHIFYHIRAFFFFSLFSHKLTFGWYEFGQKYKKDEKCTEQQQPKFYPSTRLMKMEVTLHLRLHYSRANIIHIVT